MSANDRDHQERPGAARRARLQSTPEGREMLAAGHRKVAEALGDDLLPLVCLRMSRGLSQSDLAERIGMLQPKLSCLENGHVKDPDLATLQRHAAALAVDIDSLKQAYVDTIDQSSAKRSPPNGL